MAAAAIPMNEPDPVAFNTPLGSLLPALHKLDRLLDFAVKSMQAGRGSDSLIPFRGLYVDREQVDRLLSQEPGMAQFQPVTESVDTTDSEVARTDSSLSWLVQAFGLSSFEADVMILALASEIDLRYEKIYSYLQDDVTRKRPTVELALNLFCSSAEEKFCRRADFSPKGKLIRHRLLQVVPDPNQVEPSSLAYYLKLDDQIKHLLLGQSGLDERLAGFCQLIEPSLSANDLALSADLKKALLLLCNEAQSEHKPLHLYFQGGVPEIREATEALAGLLGHPLLSASIDRLPEKSESSSIFDLLVREAELQRAILFIAPIDELYRAEATVRRQDLLASVARHTGITVLAGKRAWEPQLISAIGVISIEFEAPDFRERYKRWESELARLDSPIDTQDLAMLAGRFRLTPLQIAQAARTAQLNSRWRWARTESHANTRDGSLSLDELSSAARSQCGQELARLAHKMEPHYGWEDLVLPSDPKAQLREICAQAECRPIVYGQWGFDRKLSLGKGLNVLFAGSPGTGKTMAAEVIAHELRLDLYRIDLSQVVSKYIGETEKNLDRIFNAAENSNAILLFDEADALFGKRSEVRDSHDRYANIEISYLLQKMEEYQGISVLATNLRQNLDEAFVRRLQHIVEFPFPDEEYRRRIWENVFPHEAPLGNDVRFDLLAREVQLAGGNIKNMALGAAFYAAGDGGVVRTEHLIQAARREHQKLARSWNPVELAKLVPARGGQR